MLKKLAFAAVALSLAGGGFAQEAEDEPARREPAATQRVLQHPYDIASFYRSPQGQSYFGYTGGDDALSSRYPIASFYRNRQGGGSPGGYGYQGGYGFSNFWTGGYSATRPGLGVGFRTRIGQNGDLFLFAPVFLAPVGPLAGAFGY